MNESHYSLENIKRMAFLNYAILSVNGAWFVYYSSRIFTSESVKDCDRLFWFYSTYTNFTFCCYPVLLFITLPKRPSNLNNSILMDRVYSVVIVSTIGVTLSFMNNTVIITSFAFKQNGVECMTSFERFMCHITFIGTWLCLVSNSTNLAMILWYRYRETISVINNQGIQIELLETYRMMDL